MKKIIILASIFLLSASTVFAQSATNDSLQRWGVYQPTNSYNQFQVQQSGTNLTYTPLEPLYPYEQADINTPGGFVSLLNNLFRLLLSIGALIAVVTLVVGGIAYMMSEALDKKDEARNRMKASIYGLLLLAGSYLILNTIDPNLLNVNLNPGALSGQQPQTNTPQTNTPAATGAQPQQDCERRNGVYMPNDPNGPCLFTQ